jgi:IPT/TIG domain
MERQGEASMSIPRTSTPLKVARIAAVTGLACSLLLASSESSQAVGTTGLAPATGGALTDSVVVLTGKDFANVAGTSQVLAPGGSTYGVSFASGTCATDAAAGHTANQIDAASIAVASSTRLVVEVPGGSGGLSDTVASGTGLETKKEYNLCVYSANLTNGLNKLMTNAKFTVYPKPTLAATNFLSLSGGASTGGQAISVVGDTSGGGSTTMSGYFTAKTTATLGGMPLLGIKVAKDGNSFSAVTPAIPVGQLDLVVATEGGSVTATGAYASSPALVVSPNLVAPAGGTVISIKGKGFSAIRSAPGFGVVFFAGGYDPSSTCSSVQVVSDTELVCSTPALAPGAYNVVVTDDTTGGAATFTTVASSGATVTAASF